jgi:hypothetical protein
MNFSEALKAMKMGNKISREAWRGEISCMYIHKGANIRLQYPDGTTRVYRLGIEELEADDWFLVT